MRKSRYTDSQILAILKQVDEGAKMPDLCREHGMSAPMFYKCAPCTGRHGRFADEAYERVLGSESPPQESVCRREADLGHPPG